MYRAASAAAAAQAKKTVLISGGGIAGPALALCLARHGTHEPVVVERAPSLRLGGQNVDVAEGPARRAAQLMGIEGAIRECHTGERGVRVVSRTGAVCAAFPAGDGGASLTKELEIVRGDLSRLLYERTVDDCEYIFGDHVVAMEDDDDRGVTVTFASGGEREFDLVVAADGSRSTTRGLIIRETESAPLRPLGVYCAFFTIPRGRTDSEWATWYNAPRSRIVLLRPDNVGTTRVSFFFLSPPRDYETLSPDALKEVLADTFADAGWETPRVIEGMCDADDVYCDYLSQVVCPRWSAGRCALLGDAAYGPTPITGQGTSLAILGAYVLAGELGANGGGDHRGAFERYDAILRGHVEACQRLPPGVPRIAAPRTEMGVWVLNKVAGIVAGVSAYLPAGALGGGSDSFQLPLYEGFDRRGNNKI